jgi:hypothetical protein
MTKDARNPRINYLLSNVLLGPFVFLFLNLMISPGSASNLCEEKGKQLRGDFERFQGDGGLWAQMERSGSLKDKSALGFQVDNKLMRIVVIFETLCADGSQKETTSKSYERIKLLLEQGKKIHRTHGTNMNPKTFLNDINNLNSELDKLINGKGV